MLSFESVTLAILCIGLSGLCKAQEAEYQIIFNESPEKGQLSYANCTGSELKQSCTVYIGTYSENNTDIKSCGNVDLSLQSRTGNPSVVHQYTLMSLGSDKLILLMKQSDSPYTFLAVQTLKRPIVPYNANASLRAVIIDKKQCNSSEAEPIEFHSLFRYPDRSNVEGASILPYADTYDVFYRNYLLCGRRRCRATFNAQGKQISHGTGFLSVENLDEMEIYPIAAKSPSKGFFLQEKFVADEKTELVYMDLINADGKVKSLDRFFGHDSGINITNVIVSNSQEKYGMCVQFDDAKLKCSQFDSIGKELIKVELNLNIMDSIIKMYNLKKGGFALLKDIDNSGFVLTKINSSDKRQDESSEITGIDCESTDLHVNFIENKNAFCLLLICQAANGTSDIKVIEKCYNDLLL